VITHDPRTHTQVTLGWDAGPFNHYPDALVRREKDEPCDRDGRYGGAGRVHVELLRRLFDSAAVTRDGKNYLLLPPPKSSDPEWYRLPAELSGEPPVGGQGLTFEDRVRTAEYFAAYVCFHALCGLPEALEMPGHYALCGGGWRNPVVRAHFEALMRGDGSSPVLPEHQTLFSRARQRLQAHGTLSIEAAEAYGFDGTVMEARAFADAAVCRITGEPFTDTAITGVPRPAVCGLIRFPGGDEAKATPALRAWLDRYRSRTLTREPPGTHHPCWSRAVAGWSDRFTS
ncbi:MAG TPA: anhydro-N-acetylmuramic acid kinase, partial [Myxococcaceae bacterium]|nr:anhydro-N-acetylmuramic acid kinase [Myxococcaceae bacterium]